MTCKEAREAAVEQPRSGSPIHNLHFDSCLECSRFLKTQQALTSVFPTLARDVPVPADLEAKLLAKFDAARHPSRRFRFWWLSAATLATLLVFTAEVAIHRPTIPLPIVSEPFVEIPYTAPLAPYERTRIVRMDVPAAALIAAGFEVHVPDAGASLLADVLFGQDGRAHAIRLIANSAPTFNSGEYSK